MEKRAIQDRAVALRYHEGEDDVPVVTAKGRGYLAERIKDLARESGVPIQEDPQLVDYLMALDLYEEIPPQLYAVVAEVLAYIYSLDKKYR